MNNALSWLRTSKAELFYENDRLKGASYRVKLKQGSAHSNYIVQFLYKL